MLATAIFAFFACASCDYSVDMVDRLIGNWSATTLSVLGGQNVSGLYWVELVGEPGRGNNYTINVYKSEPRPLFAFDLSFKDDGVVLLGSEESVNVNMTGVRVAATGRFGRYLYNFVVCEAATAMKLDLIDRAENVFITVGLRKIGVMVTAPVSNKYSGLVMVGLSFVASQGFAMWNQRGMMRNARQQAEAQCTKETEDGK